MSRLVIADAPVEGEAANAPRLMPGTDALTMMPLATTPSGSVACSAALPGSPNSAPKLAGQLVAIGRFSVAHGASAEPPLRGIGAPVAKSLPFWSLSPQPWSARSAAVVLLSVGVAAAPSKAEALEPKPTRSRTAGLARQSADVLQVSRVVLVTSAPFPEVADIEMLPVASGVGSGCVPPVPAASWTSRY